MRNHNGLLRFKIEYDTNNEPKIITEYHYNLDEELIGISYSTEKLVLQQLQELGRKQ